MPDKVDPIQQEAMVMVRIGARRDFGRHRRTTLSDAHNSA